MAAYEPVIGLEIHVELTTNTKVFCGCSTAFGAEPNTQVCPVCIGMPGVLPVINERVVEYAIRAALALNCRVAPQSSMDRKNYYYPDLPKNYQISQNYECFATDGWVDLSLPGGEHRVGIGNLHIEEDAGKNVHAEDTGLLGFSCVDLNRAGVPLLEIVSEPDIHTLEQLDAYMELMRGILVYIGVSDCRMEEGRLRFEANVSVREEGDASLPPFRVEMKNLNSVKICHQAVEFEIERQSEALERGETPSSETRLWDPKRRITQTMRSKEEAKDYRYFPEPDLVPLVIEQAWVERVRAGLPELPHHKRERLVAEYGLPEYDAAVLTTDGAVADLFEGAVAAGAPAKEASNWVMGELFLLLKEDERDASSLPPETPGVLSEVIGYVSSGRINRNAAKTVFEEWYRIGVAPDAIIKERGLEVVGGGAELEGIARGVIEANEKPVADFRAGKKQAIGFLVGQVMKETRGSADANAAREALLKLLS